MLRCQGFEVNNYDFTLGRLACESLRLVQDPGENVALRRIYSRRLPSPLFLLRSASYAGQVAAILNKVLRI